MCLKLALSSRAFFEDGAFSEALIQTYKRDLKFFTEVRIQAKRDAQEVVDFSEYEAQIRRLVDKQVIGQQIIDPDGVILVGDLGQPEDSENWSDDKTRTEADLIKTRLRKTIEQDLIDDPFAQRVFSELLKEAIRAADALFDYPGKQFTLFKDLEAQVAQRATPGVPDRFADHPIAQAFFGAFLDTLGDDHDGHHTEDDLVAEAHHINAAVENAIQTYSINPGNIEAEIRRALLPRYFKFFGGLDKATELIERVISIMRAGTSKARS
jgi:type I restriction enzyme R subunit